MGKEAYKAYCQEHPEIPLFLRYEWIGSVADDADWGVSISGPEDELKGFFVYFIKRKYGFRRLLLPPLTPFLGPWIVYPEGQKQANRIGHEKKVMEELIKGLPPYDELIMNFHPGLKNWLPFYWKGFEQCTRYTYRIPHPIDPEGQFSQLKNNIRWDIQKAEKGLKVETSEDLDALYRIKRKDREKKGTPLDYSLDYLRSLDRSLRSNGQCQLLFATDASGKKFAGGYFVMDQNCSYYLVGGTDPDHRQSGGMSLLLWEAIKQAASRSLSFDFEGSMVPGVERFFRGFGGELLAYYQVEHTPSLLLRIRKGMRIANAP